MEVENSEHNSDIYMQAVSIAYGNGLLLFSQDLSEKINAKPYQTIGTKTPVTVNLKNLPSIAKDFTIKIKMNVSGSYAEIDYDLSLSEIKDYYSASSVKGNDSSIIKPKAESYISSKFDEGVFSITGKQGIKFGIEELNSNFFQEIRCNNIFTEQKEIKGSALNFKVVEKLKNRPELLNTSLLMPNKYNLPSTSIGGVQR